MSPHQERAKRAFDIIVSFVGLIVFSPVIAIAIILARMDTGASGLFRQERIGREGRPFTVVKIRTMRDAPGTTVTTRNDSRITPFGARLRRWKLDELPQLWSVLRGDMSLVGPRPDVEGYADRLRGEDRVILKLRPGITGPASLKYKNEEFILSCQEDPKKYNDLVIWPDKVHINKCYYLKYRFADDLIYIWKTIVG